MQFPLAPLRLASVATAPVTEEEADELLLVELAPQPAASSAVAATAATPATPATRNLRLSSNILYSFVARRMAGRALAKPAQRCVVLDQVREPGGPSQFGANSRRPFASRRVPSLRGPTWRTLGAGLARAWRRSGGYGRLAASERAAPPDRSASGSRQLTRGSRAFRRSRMAS